MKNSELLSLQAWLHDEGSFMERLRQYQFCPQVLVLKQEWQYPQIDEQEYLQIQGRRYIFSREVEIRDQNEPLLFARTTIPRATLTGSERCLAYLGTRSLGSVLFSYPQLERSRFEIKRGQFLRYSKTPLWLRRSIFYFRGKSLLLTEVFLPRLINFIESL